MIRNQRRDYLHKVTTDIVENQGNIVCLENLKVKNMIENKKTYKNLRKGIIDNSFAEFKQMLEYKAFRVLKVDTYFPSSQLCSKCGSRKKMSLSDRIYRCDKCGLVLDRDLNASLNILTNAVG